MLANIVDGNGNKPLSGALASMIVPCNGVQVGVVALAEDWRSTLPGLPPSTVYFDHAEVGTRIAAELREVRGPPVLL